MGVHTSRSGAFFGTGPESDFGTAREANRAMHRITERLGIVGEIHPAALLVRLDAELQAREDGEREQQDALAGREVKDLCEFMDAFQEAFITTDPLESMSYILRSAGFLTGALEEPTPSQVANTVHDILTDLVESL